MIGQKLRLSSQTVGKSNASVDCIPIEEKNLQADQLMKETLEENLIKYVKRTTSSEGLPHPECPGQMGGYKESIVPMVSQ